MISLTINLGGEVRITGEVTNTVSTLNIDPDVVSGWTRDPDGNVTEYTYGTDSEMARLALGEYQLTFLPDEAGMWYAGIYSTGEGAAATDDVQISVRSTRRTRPPNATASPSNC